jgi:hypothetical protein
MDIMANIGVHALKVVLELKWAHGDVYDAKVSVTVTDSCYVAGDLKVKLPLGQVGIPEIEPLTFSFTHGGGPCSDIVKTVSKTIQVTFSAGKPTVTAYAVVNGEVVGQDTKPFPRKK